MGIPRMIARAIVQEHKYKPITGSGLLIGRQTMPFTIDEAIALVESEGVTPRKSLLSRAKNFLSNATDDETRYGKGHGVIKDTTFFSPSFAMRLLKRSTSPITKGPKLCITCTNRSHHRCTTAWTSCGMEVVWIICPIRWRRCAIPRICSSRAAGS